MFADGSSNDVAAFVTDGRPTSFQTNQSFGQKVELRVVLKVFETLLNQASNLYTDSCYIACLSPHIETAVSCLRDHNFFIAISITVLNSIMDTALFHGTHLCPFPTSQALNRKTCSCYSQALSPEAGIWLLAYLLRNPGPAAAQGWHHPLWVESSSTDQ